jgi:hypothetical protein
MISVFANGVSRHSVVAFFGLRLHRPGRREATDGQFPGRVAGHFLSVIGRNSLLGRPENDGDPYSGMGPGWRSESGV